MARMDHVVKVGEPESVPAVYLEDYVYTFLKKETSSDKRKFFLFGEREGEDEGEKLYIYGIAHTAKEQNTYFKDFNLLGILKLEGEERILCRKNGKEMKLSGFYIFYAPNQSMQEYLVDTCGEKKEKEKVREKSREKTATKGREYLREKQYYTESRGKGSGNFLFYLGCLCAVILLVMTVSRREEGRGFALKEKITQALNTAIDRGEETGLIIEETKVETSESEPKPAEAEPITTETETTTTEAEPASTEAEPVTSEAEPASAEVQAVTTEEAVEPETAAEVPKQQESTLYIVQDGDTLAYICEKHYGDTAKIKEVCSFNGIENEDYIAPGQKLYLP